MAKEIDRVYKPTVIPEALINKMRKPEGEDFNIDRNELYNEVNSMGAINKSNQEILDLFPDMQVAKETLVSNIVGGINMFNNPIVYKLEDSMLDSSSKTAMLGILSKHMNKVYNVKDKLTTMVDDALFNTGSYCELFIPENVISDMLNSKLTSDVEALDILTSTSLDMEYIQVDGENTSVSIGTEMSIFNTNIAKDIKPDMTKDMDVEGKDELKSIKKLFLKAKVRKEGIDTLNIKTIDDVDRASIGIPLIVKIPSESIIPITTGYDSSKHIKYILMLDEQGNPLKYEGGEDELAGKSHKDVLEAALAKQQSDEDTTKKLKVSNKVIFDTITKSILSKVQNGTTYSITEDMLNIVYYMAFTRHLAETKTRFIILEPDNVNYLAFDYRNNGTGKSMLERLGPLVSMRATLLMTRMNANIDNSITKFKVVANIDSKDKKYKRTAANIIQAAYNSRSSNMLFNVRDLNTLNSLISRAGIFFQINHEKLPNMDIDFENINTDKREPDTDFYDILKKDSLKSFGLTPENIEDATGDEYATGLKIKSALFYRRIEPKRYTFNLFLTSYVGKAINNDSYITRLLLEYIEANYKNILKYSNLDKDELKEIKKYSQDSVIIYILQEFKNDLLVHLPNEEPIENNALNEAYNSYKDRLEEYMETMFSPEALPDEFIGEVGGKLDAIKGAVHNTLLRKWMSDNNYMAEVVNVFDIDDKGVSRNSAAEEFIGYLKKVIDSSEILFSKDLSKILKKSGKMDEKFNNFLDADGDDEEPDAGGEEPDAGGEEPEPAGGEEPEPAGGEEPEV